MGKKLAIELAPLGDKKILCDLIAIEIENLTLRQLIEKAPSLCTSLIKEEWMDHKADAFNIIPVELLPGSPYFYPPGLSINAICIPVKKEGAEKSDQVLNSGETTTPVLGKKEEPITSWPIAPENTFPKQIKENEVVLVSYSREIQSAVSFLDAKLSILIVCDKLVVDFLWPEIVNRSRSEARVVRIPSGEDGGIMSRSLRQRQLEEIKSLIADLKENHVLVIPHLDLLAGGSDDSMSTEARELIELIYEKNDRLILAFIDRSLSIPEVLAARFAVRMLISGVPRMVQYPNQEKEQPLGYALVTEEEASHFSDFKPEDFYKNVAGMNPLRLRHAIRYAVNEKCQGTAKVASTELYHAIRAFKVQTSASFEVPNIQFEQIGGYKEVQAELLRAIALMNSRHDGLDDDLRRDLIPRGFIFFGPPGTGKTLFAKAIAHELNAAIQVVSGPEVTDMYVGESERKVREIFAEARRNAPSVLVFDEFDAIATKRSGRDDGGSRAGNAIVAQILTEMDGFRPEVPVLIIGTTNRIDIIDEALLRPSRFKPIGIGLPDTQARKAIAKIHAHKYKITTVTEQLFDLIAYHTNGFSGDDIQSLFRDACMGFYCHTPAIPPDAARFGSLIGELNRKHIERTVARTEYRSTALENYQVGEDVGTGETMLDLNN